MRSIAPPSGSKITWVMGDGQRLAWSSAASMASSESSRSQSMRKYSWIPFGALSSISRCTPVYGIGASASTAGLSSRRGAAAASPSSGKPTYM